MKRRSLEFRVKSQESGVRSSEKALSRIHLSLIFLVFILLIAHYSLLTVSAADNTKDQAGEAVPAKGNTPQQEVLGTVDEIQKKLSGVKDIKGTFVQNSYIKDLDGKQKYSGSFFIKKPSQMMWEYDSPREEKVFIRKTDTLIYKESQNQLFKMKFSKEAYSQVPIALLESLENIWNDFDISLTQKNALKLQPKRKVGFIKTIVLESVSEDFPLKMFTIFDKYGNIIMIELKNVKINSGLNDSLFIFEAPPDAEVFDMNE